MPIFSPNPTEGDPAGGGPGTPPTAPPDPWSAEDLDAATQFYTNYIHEHHIESFGQPIDGVYAYQLARRNGLSHADALQAALTQLGWDHNLPPVNPPPPPP